MTKRNRQKVQDAYWDKREQQGGRQEAQNQKFQDSRRKSIKPLYPKNPRQNTALDLLENKQLTVLCGSAGSGKSELMCWYASKLWLEGVVDNIIITRPNKSLGGDDAAIPGNDFQKILPYTMSMLQKLKKYLGVGVLRNNLRTEMADVLFEEVSGIQVYSLEKLQGLSFDSRTILLADEIQSATVAQVKSLVTRMEQGARIVIAGDVTQSALDGLNGLQYLTDVIEDHYHEDIGVVRFRPEDCCREGISAHFTEIFEREGRW